MNIAASIRGIGKKVLGPRGVRLARRYLRPTAPGINLYKSQLAGKQALEIGGPSEIFSDDGFLPIYSILKGVDNCLFAARTIWAETVESGRSFQYHPDRAPGTQFICEATDLGPIRDSSYDLVLASHCLEHVANPLRALQEWHRILIEGGLLLLILPHKDGTFDWRRPVTQLNHMIEDYERDIREDDLTHLSEVLALHDLEKDPLAGSPEQFKQRCLQNGLNRAMHHHVFNTPAAAMLVDQAGFQLIRVTPFRPNHIIILADKRNHGRDNAQFLRPEAGIRLESPFPSDRQS